MSGSDTLRWSWSYRLALRLHREIPYPTNTHIWHTCTHMHTCINYIQKLLYSHEWQKKHMYVSMIIHHDTNCHMIDPNKKTTQHTEHEQQITWSSTTTRSTKCSKKYAYHCDTWILFDQFHNSSHFMFQVMGPHVHDLNLVQIGFLRCWNQSGTQRDDIHVCFHCVFSLLILSSNDWENNG